MRVSIDNGNGMMCDSCGRLIMPKSKEMVKCMCVTPHEDNAKASTGMMMAIGTVDMCNECYQKILGSIVHKPRRIKKNRER